jgi:hypothetical protein
MHFRVRWHHAGHHIHCRIFESRGEGMFANNGALVFGEDSWPDAYNAFVQGGFEILTEDDVDRERLREMIEAGMADVAAGRVVDGDVAFARIDARIQDAARKRQHA